MRRNETPVRRVNPSGKVRWVARYTDKTGKRQRNGTYEKEGPCKRPADDGRCCAQHAIWAAYEAQERDDTTRTTVGDFAATWLDRFPRPERTAAAYRGRIRAIIDVEVEGTPFRDLPIADIRRKHIIRLVDVMLRDHGRAASGTRAVVSVLGAMFEDAISDDETDLNPAIGVRIRASDPRVRKPKREITVASFEEMHAFARAAGRYEPMVRVLSDCGLRLGEMLALECKHVDGENLHVEQTAWHGVITPGTKQADKRVVPLPPTVRGMLAPLAKDRIGLLFPNRQGGCWNERGFYRSVWYPAQAKTGMMIRPHDMRHSWVSELRYAGVDPVELAQFSGHTVGTATRIYTHSLGRSADLVRQMVIG